MTAHTYNLNQGLQVCAFPRAIQIGKMPPTAQEIQQPPKYLWQILRYASTPISHDELLDHARQVGNLSTEAAHSLISQLIEASILTRTWIDRDGRYSRHDLYYGITLGDGFRSAQLANRTVAIVGVGGIGTNVALQLSAAGVGHLVLIDEDVVELSNLTRQFLFSEADVGTAKVDAAAQALVARNSCTRITARTTSISDLEDLTLLLAEVDLAVLSADEPPDLGTWINSAAHSARTAFSVAGYQDAVGIVGPLIVPGSTGCLECFEKSARPTARGDVQYGAVNANLAYQAPSFGPLNAVVAGIQTAEALRYLLIGETKTMNARIAVDSITWDLLTEQYSPWNDCIYCGSARPVSKSLSTNDSGAA